MCVSAGQGTMVGYAIYAISWTRGIRGHEEIFIIITRNNIKHAKMPTFCFFEYFHTCFFEYFSNIDWLVPIGGSPSWVDIWGLEALGNCQISVCAQGNRITYTYTHTQKSI